MNNISVKTSGGIVEGFCDPKFSAVKDQFIENFERRGELGANVALTLDGKLVLDLWGGQKSKEGDPWTQDTMCIVYSSTKGVAALCVHMLVERGLLDLDAPIAQYWPEFAQGGKESALVSMALDHTAGVPHIRTPIKEHGYNDYDYMANLVAREEAFWVPGARTGYHGITFAWTIGELVRRASGKRLGKFLRDELAGPLGADFWIGLPLEHEARVAPHYMGAPTAGAMQTRFIQAIMNDPNSISHLFTFNSGKTNFNMRATHAAEIASANGIGNGRALALLYAPFANGGGKFVSKDVLARMGRVSSATHEDATLLVPTRFALGFMKSIDNRKIPNSEGMSCLLSDAAFGHVGMGGSIGFADPDCGMSFGYSMNQQGAGILLNERGQSMIDAAYEVLGYRSNASGVWAM
jgi:CubicO group peptidase (beta-lactamase class C family)